MSKKTNALSERVKQMLENRGSLSEDDVDLLKEVVVQLEKFETLKGKERQLSGAGIVQLILRFILDQQLRDGFSEVVKEVSEWIDKLN